MTRNALIIVLAVIWLAGCTMMPHYSRPEPPVPPGWPTGPAYAATREIQAAPLAADVGWRDFYTDARLQKVITLALANNRDLRIAALNIERAQGLYRIQRAQLFPTVSAFGDLSAEKVASDLSMIGRSEIVRQYDLGVGVSAWELDFFGRIRSLKESALQQYLATEQALRSARISLMAQVAYAYMTLAADRDNLKLTHSTFTTRRSSFDLIERRFKVGSSSALDLRQAQTLLEAARADVAAFTRVVALDENALNLLVGAPVPADLLSEELDAISPPRDVSPGLSSEVLLRRPDIVQAENQLKAANANIGAARAAFFPRVLLTGSLGGSSARLAGLFEAGSGVWTFAPQITLPIFDTGSRLAGLAVAKADRDIYIAQYEKAIQTAFREVADALAQRGTIDSQLAAQEALVRASEESYRLSNARYTKGIDNYLNVLDAQRSLYAAQQGLISLRLARLGYLVTMYKVLGGGTQG
jgi:multidrug efflux system outer membrane protein